LRTVSIKATIANQTKINVFPLIKDNYIPGIPRPQDLASTPSEDLDLANWGIENHNRQIAQTEAYHRLQVNFAVTLFPALSIQGFKLPLW